MGTRQKAYGVYVFLLGESDSHLSLRASRDWVCVAITAESSLSPVQLCIYVYLYVCEFCVKESVCV